MSAGGPQMTQRGTVLTGFGTRGNGHTLMAVPIITSPAVAFGTPRDLFVGLPADLVPTAGHDVSADGKRLLVVLRQAATDTPSGLVVVQSWFEEFRKR